MASVIGVLDNEELAVAAAAAGVRCDGFGGGVGFDLVVGSGLVAELNGGDPGMSTLFRVRFTVYSCVSSVKLNCNVSGLALVARKPSLGLYCNTPLPIRNSTL